MALLAAPIFMNGVVCLFPVTCIVLPSFHFFGGDILIKKKHLIIIKYIKYNFFSLKYHKYQDGTRDICIRIKNESDI